MVFRCNLDGSEFETLGWNFRNNWEVAVDSFGTLWQCDNDDDGNHGVRINYVMEFGNYGYKDEITGAGWQTPRDEHGEGDSAAALAPERSRASCRTCCRPAPARRRASASTKATLLPKVFHEPGDSLRRRPEHRAGPIRSKKDGAGYKAEIVNILDGARDNWFRPSRRLRRARRLAVRRRLVRPGRRRPPMQDVDHGRIFRVAPPGRAYTVPKFDFATADGAIAALQSPESVVRATSPGRHCTRWATRPAPALHEAV